MSALALRRRREYGLTLVEVLIALTLLGVALLPVIVGFSQALMSTSESSISAAAASIARAKVEELKGTEFADIESQAREPRDLNLGDSFFEVSVTVYTVRPDDAAHCGLKKAEVGVYRAGGSEPVVLTTTYLTPYGV